MDSREVYSLQPNTIQHYDKRAKAGDPRPTMVGVGEKGEAGGMRRKRGRLYATADKATTVPALHQADGIG